MRRVIWFLALLVGGGLLGIPLLGKASAGAAIGVIVYLVLAIFGVISSDKKSDSASKKTDSSD
jgi:hypothetical protein